ncbi:tautomerase family protein [Serratia marcescens]|uniref:tautomerase family protein n=1 Tax=Serratia marcescens TaxID=615 RepID=UPI0034D472FC
MLKRIAAPVLGPLSVCLFYFTDGQPALDYFGGEPADDFVRVTIDHIARAMDNDAEQQQFLAACTRILQPYIAARGLRWELHVDETPFSLWTIDGLKPPAPGTVPGEKWRSENRPSAWEGG